MGRMTKVKDKESNDGIIEIEEIRKKKSFDSNVKASRIMKKINSVKNNNKKPVSPKILIIGIMLILIVVYLITDISTGGFISTVNGKFISVLTKNASADFSVNTDAENVYGFNSYGNGYVMLTENGIAYVDSDGSVSSRQQLTYSLPSMEIMGRNILVFDRGNTSYSIIKNKSLYSQMSTDKSIIDASVSKKENYAIAVKDENAKCILYGYNGRGKVIYQWNCPDGYIADIAMNKSGSKVAVTVVNSENAVLSSKIYILDFEYDSAYAEFEYKSEIVIGSKFITNRKLQIVTDKNVYNISSKTQDVAYSYGSADICYTSLSQGNYTAVVTNDHTHDNYYTLTVFGKNGKLKYTTSLNGKVLDVSASDKSVSVLFDNKTETYSNNGKLVGTTENINYNNKLVLNGNYLFVLSADSVKRFASYGITSAVYNYEDSSEQGGIS